MADGAFPVPIFRPKLHRPLVAPDIVPLEDQLERLEAGRERPLTLVSAPAGYGKSTLIAGWLEGREEPSVWLTLDEADSDLRVLLSHLIAGLREEFPEVGEELLDAIRGPDLPPSRVLAGLLVNDLDHLGARVVVTLDDYHRIQVSEVHGLIDSLLEHPQPGLHLVVITRRDPPLSSRSLRARGHLTEVRIEDLRLEPGEAATFVEQVSQRPISEVTASRLHQGTEGWPAGLRLAALALRRRSDATEVLAELDWGFMHIQQYLIGEVLAQQPPEVQDYLRRTSILERMCAPLCEVVGPGNGGKALSGLEFVEIIEREGLFLIPEDEIGEWYRYHHLFQDLLHIQLAASATPAEIAALHSRAAHWLERHGWVEEALHHHVLGAEPAEAEGAIVRHRLEMLDGEQWHRLATCLHLVPSDLVDQSIDLQILAALSADKRGRYVEMEQALDRAEELLAESSAEGSSQDSRRGQVEMMRAGLLAHLAQGREARGRAEQALELLPEEDLSDRAYALFILACGLQMTGDRAKAHVVLGQELERHARDSATFHGRLLQALGLVEWLSGELSSLRQIAITGIEVGERQELEETAVWSRFFLGAAQYHLGELDEAKATLDPVVRNRFGPSFHIHVMSVQVTSFVEQALGHPGRARELVGSLAEHLLEIGNESYRRYVGALQAELAVRQGRRAEALRWATNYQPGTRWAGYHFSEPELIAVKVLLLEGTDDGLERAHEMLKDLHAFYSSSHNNLFLIETLALQALYFAARGAADKAVERLGEAISLARPNGFIRLFVDLGVGLGPLLHRLDLDGEGLRYVGRILAALKADSALQVATAQGKTSHPIELVESLTPREVEVLSLIALHLSNKEIGERLFISPETVKHHVKNLYGKLEVHNRRDAVAKANGLGILDATLH